VREREEGIEEEERRGGREEGGWEWRRERRRAEKGKRRIANGRGSTNLEKDAQKQIKGL
jgi:hypothetical protein